MSVKILMMAVFNDFHITVRTAFCDSLSTELVNANGLFPIWGTALRGLMKSDKQMDFAAYF